MSDMQIEKDSEWNPYKSHEAEVESLRQQLAECQATNGKLREALEFACSKSHRGTVWLDIEDVDKLRAAITLPNDATALNELIAERTASLTEEIERLKDCWSAEGAQVDTLRKQNAELTAQRDAAMLTLENCRLLAARNRNEDWAKNILRFCSEIGVNGNPLRTDAAIANCKEPGK